MNHLVFQSDFGLVDGAVSAMYGVAYTVEPRLNIHDLTHDITPYNIWEASYRLIQTIRYWPQGTIFVSVVDPRWLRPKKCRGQNCQRSLCGHAGQRNPDPHYPL